MAEATCASFVWDSLLDIVHTAGLMVERLRERLGLRRVECVGGEMQPETAIFRSRRGKWRMAGEGSEGFEVLYRELNVTLHVTTKPDQFTWH